MVLRGGHVGCTLVDSAGAGVRAVAWRAEDSALGRRLLAAGGSLHVAGQLKIDDWNGRNSAQLEVEDAADPRQAVA